MTKILENQTLNAYFPIFLTFFMIHIFPFSLSDPRIPQAGLFCGPPPSNTGHIPLFARLMEGLLRLVTNDKWGNYSINSNNVSVYSLAQCYNDLSQNDCIQCFVASRERLPRCIPSASGRVFLDGCFMRYDNYSFFDESVDASLDRVNCSTSLGFASGVGLDFGKHVGELIDNVTASAAVNEGYAVEGNKGVFGLAECWNSVSRDGCRACLAKANREIRTCLPGREGRALNAGCYLRYSTVEFFSNQSQEINRNSGVSKTGKTLAISLSMLAFCMLSLFAGYAAYRRWNRSKQARNNLSQIPHSHNKSNLNFKYEILEKATNYFDPSRKVGQGGAGSVYRGTLPNGETVAVKRLLYSTRQWVDIFFNEVNLISGIEHKNLVKLLGHSIEGPESLLVYEFVPNKSLEHYLFGKNKIKILNWNERYNIIIGTAEGLTFLHGGSKYRIIHRDIKLNNVLLDENLDPKIADFGLSRCFAADKTHLTTGIAGTLGYMAPEYLVKGQLTEKADVYSFGVLVLEVVCARKNNAFVDDSGSLLQTVWKLYQSDRLSESVDPCLKGDHPSKEASKVLRIGLLCVQASVARRPSMADIVKMLIDENCEIPEPSQPPFLNSNALPGSSTSSTSNAVIKFGPSYPSTESISIQSFDGQSRTEEIRSIS